MWKELDPSRVDVPGFGRMAWAGMAIAAAVFVAGVDLVTPLGFAVGTLYLIPVVLSALAGQRNLVWLVAVVCALLTVLGFVLSPTGFEIAHARANRVVSILSILLIASLSVIALRHFKLSLSRETRSLSRLLSLEDAQRLLTRASRLARMGAWRVDLDANTVAWSDEVAAIHEEPPGASPTIEEGIEYYAPEFQDRIREVFTRCARDGTPFDEILQIITAKGNRVWVRSIGEAVRDEKGRIHAVRGAFQDISELVEMQKRSESLSSQLRATLENISDAFLLLDRDWRFVFVNQQAARIIRRESKDLIGKVIWEEFPDAVGLEFKRQYEYAVETGQAVRFEEYFPPLQLWASVKAYPTPDGLAVYFMDITEEKARAEQLTLLETAIERLNDMVLITEADTIDGPEGPRIVFVNNAFEAQTGYTRQEIIGRTPRILQGPKTSREELDKIRQALERQAAVRAQLVNYRKNGEEFLLELEIVPIFDDAGECTHFVAVERDVTEQQALNERLRQSQKLESIGQLTGGLAHDFNNLLTVILGNAEALSQKLSDDKEARLLAEVTASAAERGAQLTNRLLAFARRQPLEPRPIDVNQLVGGLDDLLRRTLGEQIEIELVRGGGLWKALADPGQLENAILNLAINARDAMPDGGRLTIETSNAYLDDHYAAREEEVTPGQYVMISVSDTGMGMDAETVRKAFDPFFTTKPVGKGSGLGLSMVYGFAKQSGGHPKIYSEKGEGTTVKLYLPRARASAEEVRDGVQACAGHSRGETILVVEDDDLVRSHVRGQLESLGYEVVTAASGEEAIEVLRQMTDIDLLFTDVIMPGGVSGKQVAEEAARLRPGLKILFTSGYTENAIVHQGRLDPGVQLLSKPYRRADLARKIREVLDGP